jgi:hypothetical protein
MNRKNSYSIRNGNTVDKYGRVFEFSEKEFLRRRRPLPGDKSQTRSREAFPAPNSMRVVGIG